KQTTPTSGSQSQKPPAKNASAAGTGKRTSVPIPITRRFVAGVWRRLKSGELRFFNLPWLSGFRSWKLNVESWKLKVESFEPKRSVPQATVFRELSTFNIQRSTFNAERSMFNLPG